MDGKNKVIPEANNTAPDGYPGPQKCNMCEPAGSGKTRDGKRCTNCGGTGWVG